MSDYRDEVEEELHKAEGPDRWRDLRLIENGVRLGLEAARQRMARVVGEQCFMDHTQRHNQLVGQWLDKAQEQIEAIDADQVLRRKP